MFDFEAAIAAVQRATEAGGESMPRITIAEANAEVRAMIDESPLVAEARSRLATIERSTLSRAERLADNEASGVGRGSSVR